MYANLEKRKVIMTKSEAKAAGKIGTDEFEELREYMAAYPTFTIEIKAPAKRKTEFSGLNYDYMKKYIAAHDDDDHAIMDEFNTLIAQDKKDNVEGSEHLEAASFFKVKTWFLKKFPEIKKYKEEHDNKVQEILSKVA